ncbi:UDP-2,4-diacetamido-2,4,6-trideoxy-beta-L-altropyranose hydrolase [Pseudodesulfovibrio sp.]|nr:UDP-2,4-diacetamido-2,4,6-trideoxy-beta-L-altropyranose hydrolase [Pseudodesulfovibrio sp.]
MSDTLLFRADATPEIGAGHVMRCLAIAQAWVAQGGRAIFTGRYSLGTIRARLEAEGCEVREIPKGHSLDPAAVSEIVDSSPWIVLDGYHFTPEYHRALLDVGYRLAVIDDLMQLPHYAAHLIVNPNPGAEEYSYPAPRETIVLQGARYALVRQEFRQYRSDRQEAEEARNILITMGGSDRVEEFEDILQCLGECGLGDLEVTLLASLSSSRFDRFSEMVDTFGFTLNAGWSTDDLPERMARTDLAVTGGGTTSFELAYIGVPMITVSLAENQVAGAQVMHENGASLLLASPSELRHLLSERLPEILSSARLRSAASKAGRNMVDGLGPERIVNTMREIMTTSNTRSFAHEETAP